MNDVNNEECYRFGLENWEDNRHRNCTSLYWIDIGIELLCIGRNRSENVTQYIRKERIGEEVRS